MTFLLFPFYFSFFTMNVFGKGNVHSKKGKLMADKNIKNTVIFKYKYFIYTLKNNIFIHFLHIFLSNAILGICLLTLLKYLLSSSILLSFLLINLIKLSYSLGSKDLIWIYIRYIFLESTEFEKFLGYLKLFLK